MDKPFAIEFDFTSADLPKGIRLRATVQVHHSVTHYKVSAVKGMSGKTILPDFDIKKKNGRWVHTDSEKQTDLSTSAGRAIDEAIGL